MPRAAVRVVTSASGTAAPSSRSRLTASSAMTSTCSQRGDLADQRLRQRGLGAVLGEDDLDLGVRDDPLHLGGGGGLVDGHRDGADGPGGEVEQGPLVAGVAHDRHPLARPDAEGDQPLGGGEHLLGEDPGGDGHEARPEGGLPLEDRALRVPGRPARAGCPGSTCPARTSRRRAWTPRAATPACSLTVSAIVVPSLFWPPRRPVMAPPPGDRRRRWPLSGAARARRARARRPRRARRR